MSKLLYEKETYSILGACFEVILEIKAVQTIVDQHKTQVLNYLHATKNPVGLLVNFGHYPQVQHVRFVI